MRGFTNVDFEIRVATENYAAVKCVIHLIPNYESLNAPVTFSGVSCAHFNNTRDFGQNYLVEMSGNRSLCRAIRNALKINIVSSEELSNPKNGSYIEDSDDEGGKIYKKFEEVLKRKGKSMVDVKNKPEV